jgi:hypothetical protein
MFNARVAQQEKERETLTACSKRWSEVDEFLNAE